MHESHRSNRSGGTTNPPFLEHFHGVRQGSASLSRALWQVSSASTPATRPPALVSRRGLQPTDPNGRPERNTQVITIHPVAAGIISLGCLTTYVLYRRHQQGLVESLMVGLTLIGTLTAVWMATQ
ncbi:hypothetical protein GCM10023335_81790 [Streptomyces siamensis]|uniref:Uncharacterized protein n=1 Tax=Streptomyces siamensis TaxID=1274986 RepID=A0ABP9JLE3_9ACTN